VLLAGLFLLNGAIGCALSARPERHPADYREVLRFLGYPETVWLQHFPESIPENTRNVSFRWDKGFLQSPLAVQLRHELPGQEIRSLLIHNREKVRSLPESSSKNHKPYLAKVPSMPPCAGETEARQWPEDFEMLVFHYKKTGGDWAETFNYGVAISIERNEIVYWAEQMD
jgi:hypothetical protein